MKRKYLVTNAFFAVTAAFLLLCGSAFALSTPTLSSATPQGPNHIDLAWSTVATPGYGYCVEIQSATDSRYTNFTDITTTQNGLPYLNYWVTEPQYTDPVSASSGNGNAAQFMVFGLMNNTAYSFRIRCYNKTDAGAVYYSAYSNTVSATTANYAVRYVSPSGSDSNNGTTTALAWATLAHASATLTAGQVCYVMAGTYTNDHIWLQSNAGTGPTARIIIQAYPGSTVNINGGSAYMYISKNFCGIDGIQQSGGMTDNSVRISSCSRSYIVNSSWAGTPTSYGTLASIQDSNYVLVYNNSGHDAVTADANSSGFPCWTTGDTYSMIANNHFYNGGHDAGTLVGDTNYPAQYNKWLNNLEDNHWGSGLHVMNNYSSADHNLIEGNIITGVRSGGSAHVYKPGIELVGSYNTVRRNMISDGAQYDTHGIEINSNSGSGTYGISSNMLYWNVFYHNQGVGIDFMQPDASTSNAIQNSVIYWNGMGNPYSDGTTDEIYAHNAPTNQCIKNNHILSKSGTTDSPSSVTIDFAGVQKTTAQANSGIAGYSGNITGSPQFQNSTAGLTGYDFHQLSTSPTVGAGIAISDPIWATTSYPGAAMSTPSIGAYEYFPDSGASSSSSGSSSSGTSTPPAAPTGLAITAD